MLYAASDIADTAFVSATSPLPAVRVASGARVDVAQRLRASRARLRAVVRGVSPDAWAARPVDGSWTACEILEHLALTEWSVVEFVRGTLLTWPRSGDLRARTPDADVLRAATDRTVRLEAPERLQPLGRWSRPGVVCASIEAARDEALALAAASGDALRARFAPHPHLGMLDGAQWLLFLAGHAERHAEQLEAIVAGRRGRPIAA